MSLLIEGMDMPKDNQQHDINLFNTADGFWADEYRFENSRSKYKTRLLYSVTEIPTPHGRLIDADRLLKAFSKALKEDSYWVNFFAIVENAPTVIEAEK